VSPEDELAALKQRATMMGISFHPSIGLEKLREKVNAAVTGETPKEETSEATSEAAVSAAADAINNKVETPAQKAKRLKDDAARLIRIRLQCMNPAKSEWPGEIISVGNAVVGNFSKFVPFNADEGWHVPNIIYKALLDRQCQVFTTVTDTRGNKTRKGKLIREFSIEILPNLTAEELHDLAQRQAMSGAIDN
jgi:hypothetical protein